MDIRRVSQVTDIKEYDLIFLGSPILYGKCKKSMRAFLQTNQTELKNQPVICFLTCMRCTSFTDSSLIVSDIFVDPAFNEPAKAKDKMNFMEKSHAVQLYLENLLACTADVKPLKVAFFKGTLDFAALGFLSRWVMKLMTKLQEEVNEGDYINPKVISSWAAEVAC